MTLAQARFGASFETIADCWDYDTLQAANDLLDALDAAESLARAT